MALADDLLNTVETLRTALPPAVFERIGRSIQELKATGIAGRATGVGERIDLPVLETLDGSPADLAAIAEGRPTVLLFYRGGWCPYCNVALQAYNRLLPAVQAAGGTILAVTPETRSHAAQTASRNDLDIPVTVDRGNAFARRLGLVFALPEDLRPIYRDIGIDLTDYNGDDAHELPVPAVYVLDAAGTVRWADIDADFTRRADPEAVLAALAGIAATSRHAAAEGLAR